MKLLAYQLEVRVDRWGGEKMGSEELGGKIGSMGLKVLLREKRGEKGRRREENIGVRNDKILRIERLFLHISPQFF